MIRFSLNSTHDVVSVVCYVMKKYRMLVCPKMDIVNTDHSVEMMSSSCFHNENIFSFEINSNLSECSWRLYKF